MPNEMESRKSIERFLGAAGFQRELVHFAQFKPFYYYVRNDPVYGLVNFCEDSFVWWPEKKNRWRKFLFEASDGVEEAYRRLEEGIAIVLGKDYAASKEDRRLLEERGFQEQIAGRSWFRDYEEVFFSDGWFVRRRDAIHLMKYCHVHLENALAYLERG